MDKNILWWIVFTLVIFCGLLILTLLQTLWEEFKKNKEGKDE